MAATSPSDLILVNTLSQKAYDHLRDQLKRGVLPPNSRLVNRSLATEIGVSLTPVREAIHRLASEGLVEYVAGAGAFVRQIEPAEIDELYQLRACLEPMAAENAARQIGAYDLEELDFLCEQFHRVVEALKASPDKSASRKQTREWFDLEERFHMRVIQASGNRWLSKVASEMRFLCQSFALQRDQPELVDVSIAEQTWKDHAELVRLLRSGDAAATRTWMEQHIETGRKYVMNRLRHQG